MCVEKMGSAHNFGRKISGEEKATWEDNIKIYVT